MKIGSLRNIITIQQATQTRNDAGEIVETWATYISPWANITPLQGREYWAAQQVQNEETIRILIHYAPGVTSKMRVIYTDRAWDIKSVSNVGTRNKETEIIAVLSPNEYKLTDFNRITDVHAIEIGSTTARIFFTTTKLGNTQVVYGTVADAYYLHSNITDETDCTFHSIELTGLTPSMTYYFKVQSQDQTGLWTSTGDLFSFTTLTGIAGGILMIANVAFAITKTAITITYNTDENCKCTLIGKLYSEEDYYVWVNVQTEHASPHSHQKTGLTEGAIYDVQLLCTTDEGLSAYAPSASGYYRIQMESGIGGVGKVVIIQY